MKQLYLRYPGSPFYFGKISSAIWAGAAQVRHARAAHLRRRLH
jgi:hypothetical protein